MLKNKGENYDRNEVVRKIRIRCICMRHFNNFFFSKKIHIIVISIFLKKKPQTKLMLSIYKKYVLRDLKYIFNKI